MQPRNFTSQPEASQFPSLPTHPESTLPRPLRVCICTLDIVGPIKNGGIGTAYASLAVSLAKAGHDVTVLYVLGNMTESGTIDTYVQRYARQKVRFVPLPMPQFSLLGEGQSWGSYRAYLWLKKQEFDVIHFHEWMAPGFHSMVAKHQGLAFHNTLMVVGTHSPSLWHKVNNLQNLDSIDDLKLDYMERQSVRHADVVISPSHYLLQWMQRAGWQLPSRAYVTHNILPEKARRSRRSDRHRQISELVFFGRLEGRKGLVLFCDAIDELTRSRNRDLHVTFLGKSGKVDWEDGSNYIRKRAQRWGFKWRIINDQDNVGAMQYLLGEGRLAVIPSLVENSPYTVLECLGAGVPFLASDVGGIPELVAREDLGAVLFPLEREALARRLAEVLRAGAIVARPAADFEDVERVWQAWHATLQPAAPVPLAPVPASSSPLVSVCLVHHDRPELLRQAVRSLEQQDYSNFEVILVDDGSAKPESHACLADLERRFSAYGWRIVRQENLYPGAARNNAARHARGEYLLFMDDDNFAKPHEISTFVQVAETTDADIVACQLDVFEGEDPPGPEQLPIHRWLFAGGPTCAGLIHNCFGDANSLVRRTTFEALGGFTEDYGVGHEDWEFLAKAAIKGIHIEVIPEAPVWYRRSPNSIQRMTPRRANLERSLRPFLDSLPEALRPMLHLTQGMHSSAVAPPKQLDVLGNPEVQRILIFLTEMRDKHPRLAKVGEYSLEKLLRFVRTIKRG